MSIDASAAIHSTAVIEPGARIGAGCRIGPLCVIGPEVVLGPDVVLHSHVAVAGVTEIGAGTVIWPFASIGHAPQDLKFRGERTELVIGARNRIREHATMNPGTDGGGGVTRIGDDNLFMMSIHVGHDCTIGNGVVMANNASLGGHCVVEDGVVMGGLCGVHQFVRIGRGAMIGGLAGVVADVIPYGLVAGDRAYLSGLNLVGLKRRDVPRAQIHQLRAAFDAVFAGDGTLQDRAKGALANYPENALVGELSRFLTEDSARAFTLPRG